ncbi:hypothetical protein MHL31_11930 [Lutibacter sp. A80]|uniref:hypothetical protein n=1 Tax=Lutibacter sp. A80 TaxID=2918453 RepID=UPI001F06C8AE|nr:hypothetical protein [Lutibacter sp. A80]UMB59783.1 hypothetical protein MHL31_11930 [Lutibacter sp. A80]
MKLNKEQIKEVEAYLNNKDVEYIDLHLEVLDHISTAIESEIAENEISFNNAFEKVKTKWNGNFKNTTSLWLGWRNNGPKLLINKCIEIYKPLFIKAFLLLLLFIAIGTILNYSFEYSVEKYKSLIFNLISFVLILYCVSILFLYVKIRLEKIKTSYSYLFQKQIMPNLFSVLIFIPYINDSYITRDGKFNLIMFAMLFVFFLTFLGARYFYKNHLKVVSNYKKYQLQ